MKILAWLALGTGLTLGFACGGNVVVDPPAEGTGGDGAAGPGPGPGPGPTSSTSGSGGMGAGCPVPFPDGNVDICGGTATSGPGGPVQCDTFFCDQGGNIYTSSCTSTTCVCSFNSQTLCTCAVDSGDICGGSAQQCCPFFFAP